MGKNKGKRNFVISQNGSADLDPDPYQNETDPLINRNRNLFQPKFLVVICFDLN